MNPKLTLVLIVACFVVCAGNFQDEFSKGFTILTREGRETPELRNVLESIKLPYRLGENYKNKKTNVIETVVCTICTIALDIVITAVKDGLDPNLVFNALIYLCIHAGVDHEDICRGNININKDTLIYIATDPYSKATPQRICSMSITEFKCPDNTSEPWHVTIPDPIESNVTLTYFKKTSKGKPIKVLHLSDLHYDPNYESGSNANCTLNQICCQAGTKPTNVEDAAGYWGDYRNCDLPWYSVVNALDQIRNRHTDIDYMYFTGDIIHHKAWLTDRESNKIDLIKVFKHFKKTFGTLPIFPTFGNHDPHPVNLFSYPNITNPEISTMWLFELAAEYWTQWLPEETKATILKGGYYTVKLRDGFRIIALNSNICYTSNFWLLYDDVDPFDQLKWLTSTLAQAEKDNEKVHIISHIPSGDIWCSPNWSRELVRVITRFSSTISAQFYGHTHDDDTVLFFGENVEEVINVAFNGGSLVPYVHVNPNYKIYYVDSNTYNVLDYETWSYNLTEANLDPRSSPRWFVLYNFTTEYNLPDTSPYSLLNLVYEMALNPQSDLLQIYFRNKNRKADTALEKGCDAECEINNLCFIVTYHYANDFYCKKFTELYNNARPLPKITFG